MRTVLMFVLALLVGCGRERPEKSETDEAYAANDARFARETGSRTDWWTESSLTIDAQIALRSEPNTPKFFLGLVSDVVEIEDVIYLRAMPLSDSPEATYLLSISETQYVKLRQDTSEDSLGWSTIRCAMTVDQLKLYPLEVEGERLSEFGGVNLVAESSLIVFGECSAVELYD